MQQAGLGADDFGIDYVCGCVLKFSMAELEFAISKLKLNKAGDKTGVFAEMLINSGRVLRQAILDVFNTILMPSSRVPSAWKHSQIRVLFKS
eukprot:4855567-Karenia_brevis.AAC.1